MVEDSGLLAMYGTRGGGKSNGQEVVALILDYYET